MGEGSVVLCILGAMIGAGFASGREILQFFSSYGPFSWGLIMLTVLCMTVLMHRAIMGKSLSSLFGSRGSSRAGEGLMLLLLLCTAGGMTAAAGELFALTIPVHHARGLGMLVTAAGCALMSGRSLKILGAFGLLLLPLLLLAMALCMRLPSIPLKGGSYSFSSLALGLGRAIGYAGMNVALAAGVLCDAGQKCDRRHGCRCVLWSGGALLFLLFLYNRALLPHAGYLMNQPLPMVALLRVYGKMGHYLSACVLYLAVVTTLIAIFRAMIEIIRKYTKRHAGTLGFLSSLVTALGGFEQIVAVAYPILGIVCFLFMILSGRKKAEAGPCPLR